MFVVFFPYSHPVCVCGSCQRGCRALGCNEEQERSVTSNSFQDTNNLPGLNLVLPGVLDA